MIFLSESLVRPFSFIGFLAQSTGQLVIIIPSTKLFVVLRWRINKEIAGEQSMPSRKMAASSSGDDSEGALPKYGWRVHLDNAFSHKPQPCYIPRWSQIPRLIGLGWRYYSTLHVKLFVYIFFSQQIVNVVMFARLISDLWNMLQKRGRTAECLLLTLSPQILVVKYTVNLSL